ncbi:MAG: hypothetical protein AB7K04_17715 [Pseudorhodoplanes sp.]
MNATDSRKSRPVRQDLDGRYGSIGMPALAAALRYRGDDKNPKYAPCDSAAHGSKSGNAADRCETSAPYDRHR